MHANVINAPRLIHLEIFLKEFHLHTCAEIEKPVLVFPHFKVVEQPNKRPKKGCFPKKRESEDKSAVAVVKSVSQLGCASQDSDAPDSHSRTKEFRGDPMQSLAQFKEFDSLSLRHVARVSGTRKIRHFEKPQVKPRHQRSPHAA